MGQSRTSLSPTTSEDVVVLIAGHDPIGEPLCTALAARGADVQYLSTTRAIEAIVASAPDLVFLVGDAAKQRGAQIRSQLVRRLRGSDLNIAVLIDGQVPPSASTAARMLGRASGVESIADRLMAWAESAHAARSQGTSATLDQVAGIVARALERPSEPAPTRSTDSAAHIVMQAAPPPPTAALPTARLRQAIPVAAGALPARNVTVSQLMPTPPLSLQALAVTIEEDVAPRIAARDTTELPSLADELESEVSTSEFAIPIEQEMSEVAIVTPVSWSTRPDSLPIEKNGSRFSPRRAVVIGALAVAACAALVLWNVLRSGPARVAESASTALLETALAARPRPAHDVAPAVLPMPSAPSDTAGAANAVAESAESDDALATAAALDDEQDPEAMGDEPELVRARALCGEGHLLRSRGRLGLAEAKYMEALRLFPRYPRAMAGLVRVHLTRGDGTEAVRWAERLVAMQPNRSNNQLLLGDAYALSGKTNKARIHWRQSANYGNMGARKRLKDDAAVVAKSGR